ncbi:hypothetical protein VPNG_08995 [Cytospora leucostoma]|uniref:Ribosomal RNA methyltransferase FtsJ domain-containing protein n=1 Tax=Cytospora leucostoma TaxID=1230097 RepID=A0A423VZY7_9PEZI|nr:hypothetical protein VPNG_08995 [Cytospora leucostoma]
MRQETMETTTEALDKQRLGQGVRSSAETIAAYSARVQDTAPVEDTWKRNTRKVAQYLSDNVPEFRRLSELRQKGWDNPKGDQYFKQQRRQADEGAKETVRIINLIMGKIAREMQGATGAFSISTNNQDTGPPMILDMCTAPGNYLEYALQINPGACAVGFSLPYDKGGHELIVRTSGAVRISLLDITLLAADMGVADSDIPPDHPHARDFLPARQLRAGRAFDLAICDGQVLRNHEPHRAAYREAREARRLTLTQLALGLEHLRPGGTMVVLLHKLEAWDTVLLLRAFAGFSAVRLFKPRSGHAKRSSFYMVARDVRSDQAEATAAVEAWKEQWRAATFETDEQRWRECREHFQDAVLDVDAFLREFGPELARMGREVWAVQGDALAKAPFIRK